MIQKISNLIGQQVSSVRRVELGTQLFIRIRMKFIWTSYEFMIRTNFKKIPFEKSSTFWNQKRNA